MSTSSLPSFIKIHQAVLEKKLKMLKFTDEDDERTDDGRWAILTRAFGSGELKNADAKHNS